MNKIYENICQLRAMNVRLHGHLASSRPLKVEGYSNEEPLNLNDGDHDEDPD